MKFLSKKDILYAIVTGLITGVIAFFVLGFLDKGLPFGISRSVLIFVVPICWLLGVQFGYFLGQWLEPFKQFGIFAAIGFTNFAVDAGVLNLLIAATGIAGGIWYPIFKGISFCVAVIHSYIWNRTWTFNSQGDVKREAIKFFMVMLVCLLINVIVASLVVHILTASPIAANIGAVVGSAVSLIFSFVGFRLVVFKNALSQVSS